MAFFDPLPNPLLLVRLLNMHKFDTNGAAIGLLQALQYFAQRRVFEPKHIVDKNMLVEISLSEAIDR